MTAFTAAGTTGADDEIPDDLFDTLPADAAPVGTEALFQTLPKLPSIEGFSQRLAQIQASLIEAQAEADSLRSEIQRKASALRALAGALEAAI